ncbi:MAG: EF-P beta-lysylation protein EpmB [Candidatus Malihini olakiniferum]
MANIVTLKPKPREDWLHQLADVITDPLKLLHFLALEDHHQLRKVAKLHTLFPLRVPWSFAKKMRKGDPLDPLLLQVLTTQDEFLITPEFSVDPLDEQQSVVPGLLHKYHNRALLLVKGGCAVNCRYCFRRHFPYQDNQGNKSNWRKALDYIRQHPELDEIIFSGGDPLMAKDHELEWLISKLENIPHLQRLRIHSRFPVVIPARITKTLCQHLSKRRLSVLLVTQINHANEIDSELRESMARLRQAGVTLLNQSVLLHRVNDNASTLASLSNALFNAGVLPYYLHVLDKVQGAAHFLVSDEEAKDIMRKLLSQVSGYLVPRLTREIGGEASKTMLDLQLTKNS